MYACGLLLIILTFNVMKTLFICEQSAQFVDNHLLCFCVFQLRDLYLVLSINT